ncbi:MAG: CHASE2 domain-containing protein [Spirochaetales bacterium]|uniref:CHASE2 domain-containing protein n=1 Tax=Candidatus Thalassospirochaeta sargassi TaxID=3119039 RepID=A0AAJ1MJD4_9SPIO|nr:CHASE2 domain-containing protein [Spirochaetales bacterium]
MERKFSIRILIAILIVIVFSLLTYFNILTTLEHRLYDVLLHLKKDIPEDQRILLVDIDDTSIEKVGVWPWSRDIVANGLLTMSELGADYAVFDIEYVQSSPTAVDPDFLENTLPQAFADEFDIINGNIIDLFGAIASGAIPGDAAEEYISQLTMLNEQARDVLISKVDEISQDNDEYFSSTIYFFGNAYMTVNMVDDYEVEMSPAFEEWLRENIAYDKLSVETEKYPKAESLDPALAELITMSAGAGFPNIIIDEDGVRRRIDFFTEYKGDFYGQLVISPFLDWAGNPSLTLTDDYLLIEDAYIPGEDGPRDLKVPRAEDGTFLINWPAKGYWESFRHLSFYYMVLHNWQEEALIASLGSLEADNFFTYYEGDQDIFAGYDYAESIKAEVLSGGDRTYLQDYRDSREYFYSEVGSFINGQSESAIRGQIQDILAMEGLSDADTAYYEDTDAYVESSFAEVRLMYEDYMKTREIIREAVDGSFCIIGSSATSTFDRGVNPFSKEYANVGTHAAVFNMLIQDSYLDDSPQWLSILLAFVITMLLYIIIHRMDALPTILWGIAIIIVLAGVEIAVFLLLGIYIQLLTPILSVLCTFLFISVMKFLETARERSYIRSAFGHYLSDAVIENLIDDPDKLSLGGEKKYMSAVFTDVKGFSSISEKLDPTDLVKILNMYLTEMSNLIMDQGGTIDKYEGDAIIAFFGAPVEFDDHAKRACRAAVRMKKLENIMNQHFMEDELVPDPLLTRIGINTGEMVVGNMGTARKMDYTIMGNAVNLAARLEGVNKQYNCWKLISSMTADDLGDEFVLRKLDRVRVVGINEPVRLYELVDESDLANEQTVEVVDLFHTALELFEDKRWIEAGAEFQKILSIAPEDGPAGIYIKRCEEYKKKAPPANWDGVFNLTTK